MIFDSSSAVGFSRNPPCKGTALEPLPAVTTTSKIPYERLRGGMLLFPADLISAGRGRLARLVIYLPRKVSSFPT